MQTFEKAKAEHLL